jgi:hypothetical protein
MALMKCHDVKVNERPYSIFSFGGKPVLAVPATYPQVKRAGVHLYKAISWRRWLFKVLLKLCMFGRIDELYGAKCISPIAIYPYFPFELFLARIRQDMRTSDLQVVVSFPSMLERGRFYANLLSSNGTQLGFSKVSVDASNDLSLAREVATIRSLLSRSFHSFEFPKVLCEGNINSYRYVVFEPLPVNARALKSKWDGIPKLCRDELVMGSVKIQRIEELSWWPSFQQEITSDIKPLTDYINSWADHEATVCFAHGDFTGSNMCNDNGLIWVFDWEDSASDAPIMTDEVRFFLEPRTRLLVNNPKKVVKLFERRFFPTFDDDVKKNSALALAFLCSRGNRSGTIMGKHWDRIK